MIAVRTAVASCALTRESRRSTRLRQSVVEEPQDVRRDRRIEVAGVLAGQPADGIAGDQGVGQGAESCVVVEILRSELNTFVRRGHRDADRNQRIATEFEEVVTRRDRFHTQTLRPDPPQCALHLRAGVSRRASLAVYRLVIGGRVGARLDRFAHGGRIRVDPIALPGKGIAGQGDTTRVVAVQLLPIHVHSGGPQLPQREQESVPVITSLYGVTHQANRAVGVRPPGHPQGRSSQAPARSHLDKHPVGIAEQGGHFVGEPHSGPNVPGPAIRIGRLFVGHPGTGDVG